MALPWLIGAAVVAGVGYMASGDDEPEECMYCSRKVYRDGMCRRHYREEQEEERENLRRENERENRRQIESEILSFKQISQRQIRNKYGVNISFDNHKVTIVDGGNLAQLENAIKELKTQNKEMEKLIKDLQGEKDAL